jgi:hypothetical protein
MSCEFHFDMTDNKTWDNNKVMDKLGVLLLWVIYLIFTGLSIATIQSSERMYVMKTYRSELMSSYTNNLLFSSTDIVRGAHQSRKV